MTDDLASYLLARYDEEAEVARKAGGGQWSLWVETDPEAFDYGRSAWVHRGSEQELPPAGSGVTLHPEWSHPAGSVEPTEGRHIARWDPARVLAEVAAKKRIVELHSPMCGDSTPYRGKGLAYCTTCTDWPNADPYEGGPMVDYPCPTLRFLAQPYADRDDFRQEWRV